MQIGQRIEVISFIRRNTKNATIVNIINDRTIEVFEDKTTTKATTIFTLRKDNTFVAKGYSMNDREFGGFIYNN